MITQISQQMKLALTESAEIAALKTGLVQRKVKVTGTNLCQTLVMGWWHNPSETVEGLSQVAKSLGLLISPQGLDQRMNKKTADCLYEILQTMINVKFKTKMQNIVGMEHFTHVYVEDSSIVELDNELEGEWRGVGGSSSKSSVKLQTRLDWKQGEMAGPYLYDGRVHDGKAGKQHERVEKGALHLRDLGYWSLDVWETAAEEGYYVLSRMKMNTKFWFEGASFDSYEWVQQQKGDEFDVAIKLGKRKKIPVRFIGRRASKEESKKRRRKLKVTAHKQGFTPSKGQLALCDWTLIVTNAPKEIMTTRDAFIWLGVRWQIELLFKLWKSVGEIDKSRSKKPWRRLCELYAKLIAMTLQHWLFLTSIWRFPNRSLTKAAKGIRLHVMRLAMTLSSQRKLRRVIKDICEVLSSGSRINRSQKQVRTYQKLEGLEAVLA